MNEVEPNVKVAPIIIGPANALAATGFPWRWCRDTAAALGVPFVGAGRKRGIRADLFVAALETRQDVTGEREPEALIASDPAAAVRRMLGKTRRSA